MGIFIRMNGLWKEIEQPYSRIDGVIKDQDVYTRVDGKPRLVFGKIKAEDIVGFRLVYYVKKDAEYVDLPGLRYNSSIPVSMSATSGSDNLDYIGKGVVYEYTDTKTSQEGVLMYEGRLLAILRNGMLLDIFGNPDPIPSLDAPLVTKSIDFTVVVSYDIRYQGYGHHTRGWNSMWSSYDLMKHDTDDEELFESDIRSTTGHVLVPQGDTNSCTEWRAIGLKSLSFERALEMVTEVFKVPEGTDLSSYASMAYPEPDVQCPGRRNDYISLERAVEIWNVVQSNREEIYNDGLFIKMCQNLRIDIHEEISCSIYGKCTLGYLTYRAALGESDCPELNDQQWSSMSMKHGSDVMDMARKYKSLSPDKVSDEIFDPEDIYCPGRDVPPISYSMSLSIFDALWNRDDQAFTDDTVNEVMDELNIADDNTCSIYGKCRYDDVSYNQALYWKTCDSADVTIDTDVIPENTSPVCEIGIARSIHVQDHHMQGARGALSQNLYSIKLDGIEMPFIVQVIGDD